MAELGIVERKLSSIAMIGGVISGCNSFLHVASDTSSMFVAGSGKAYGQSRIEGTGKCNGSIMRMPFLFKFEHEMLGMASDVLVGAENGIACLHTQIC